MNKPEKAKACGVYTVKCFDSNGNLKWQDEAPNLVMNEGLQEMNTQFFAGSTYTTDLYLGLITGPGSGTSFVSTDSLASHSGWTENTSYSGNRQAAVFGTATDADPSVISNADAVTTFTMNASAVIAGAFLCTVASGSSGVLFSAGDFTGGDKSVDAGDSLAVTYTFSLSAA